MSRSLRAQHRAIIIDKTDLLLSRILDFLLDINDTNQVPAERRYNLNLPGFPQIDVTKRFDGFPRTQTADLKSLQKLIHEVPHSDFASITKQYPELAHDLDPNNQDTFPKTFLDINDIDDYLYELDDDLYETRDALGEHANERRATAPRAPLPPPSESATHNSSANFALKNPTSVYNWLRRNAPKTFLQDLEKDNKDRGGDDHHDRDDGGGKKKRGGPGSRGGKRASAAARKERDRDASQAGSPDHDDGFGSKGKRKRDDDAYRSKAGSKGANRPVKKRKSIAR